MFISEVINEKHIMQRNGEEYMTFSGFINLTKTKGLFVNRGKIKQRHYGESNIIINCHNRLSELDSPPPNLGA